MDSQEDTADLERESATEDSGLNYIGPEDTRVNLEGTETSEYAPLGNAGPDVYRTVPKVNFEQYDGVIAAVNVDNVHWRFVYIHAVSKKIFVLDPQHGSNEKEAATQACKKFGEFFKMRRNRDSIEDWVDTKWQPGTIDHSFQEDGDSCGVFVMQMARQVVENFPKIPENIHIDPSKDWMWNCRRNMAKDILQASD
ncbi:putative protein wu:fc27b11 [Labeo rohita]|uniref:Ubiquitin-like protease family profile domain-containing protein n=1 Tax=Labeo rohita TaxID=84645 RepID=A0A498P0H4_LABRO|nr:putative protein wu:fc27b11 [Labeo rohita]